MNDRECLRTPTNVWRSFCDHCDWWRIAFVSPFALYSPLSGEFDANIFFYIRKDIRHSVRAALQPSSTMDRPRYRRRYRYVWQGLYNNTLHGNEFSMKKECNFRNTFFFSILCRAPFNAAYTCCIRRHQLALKRM